MKTFFLIFTVGFASLAVAQDHKTPMVQVQKVESTELFDEITFPARVESSVNGTVNSEADGVVTKINVAIGQQVRSKTPVITVKNMDPVYEYMPVAMLSPVNGYVSAIEVAQGTSVRKGQTLMTITDPNFVRIKVEIAASDLSNFRAGLKGTFTAPNFGVTQPVQVVVRGVSPQIDPVTGTACAEIAPVDKQKIPLGLIGRATFKVNERKGIQVPDSAIIYRGQETYVRTVDGDKAKMVQVMIAGTNRGNVELKSGLKSGDRVVVRASGFIADGQTVTVQQGNVAKN